MPFPDEKEISSRLNLHLKERTTDSSNSSYQWSSDIYSNEVHFARELNRLKELPLCLGLIGSLTYQSGYRKVDILGQSWILTKENENVRAFANQCPHRGMRLVTTECSEAKQLVCPYHNWSFNLGGRCIGIPRQQAAFPNLERDQISLPELTLTNKEGLIFIDQNSDILAPLEPHLNAWHLSDKEILDFEIYNIEANWKILVEAFLEGYHVPMVHQKTLAPAVIPQLWLNDYYGVHSRAIYPLKRFKTDSDSPLRRKVSMVYQIFPNSMISWQPFHQLFVQYWPTSVNQTQVWITTLADKAENQEMLELDRAFLKKGLLEDFDIARNIQMSIESHPMVCQGGRYEGQIQHFHENLFTWS